MSEELKESKYILSASVRAEIDRWLTRYPADQKRSGVIEALRFAQNENSGFLTTELMDAVADYLEMSKIAVYEVVSFYTMFNVKKPGRHVIDVCTNISCMLNDSEKMVEHLKKRLEIDVDQTTPDGKFTLREVECLAACKDAPVCMIGKKYYEKLTPEKIDKILQELD
jgi:NADH-quinone oxidoreductase subunit E